MSNRKWVLVGEVWVDSGTVMVVDPCYVLRDKRDEDKGTDNGLEYSDALGFDFPADDPQSGEARHKAMQDENWPAAFNLGRTQNGFVFGSGFGDGAYRIYALISDEGDWGKRVMGVFVDFDGSFDESDLPEFGSSNEDDPEWNSEDPDED